MAKKKSRKKVTKDLLMKPHGAKRPKPAKRPTAAKRAAPKAERAASAASATLTKAIAERFLKDPNAVELEKYVTIDDSAAATLAKGEGFLRLNGLKRLSDAAAQSLAGFRGWSLELKGLTAISDSVARSLAKAGGSLELGGVTKLSDAVVTALAAHAGSLYLGGLKELSDGAAKALASRKPQAGMAMAGKLDLGGVRKCSDIALKLLASLPVDLEIGVDSLSDDAAKAFSTFHKSLTLPGLRALSDAAVKSLGKLDCEGRLHLKADFCKTMHRLGSMCSGWDGLLRYRGWKITEKKASWKDLPKKDHAALSMAFDHCSLDKVELTRVTLTTPCGGETQEFFAGSFDSNDMDIGWTYIVHDGEIVAEEERD